MDSSGVIEEVEALFKKLQDLPDSIRQKALSTIQGHLPTFSPAEKTDGSNSQPKLKRGRPSKKNSVPEQETPTVVANSSTACDWSEDDEIVINPVQTSRGRNTKRISIASLLKAGRRYNSGRRYRPRKKPKKELKSEPEVIPVIKMEILDENDVENNYEQSNQSPTTYIVEAKEERESEIEQDEILSQRTEREEDVDNQEPQQVENGENINDNVSGDHTAEGEENQENSDELTSPKEGSEKSQSKRGLSIRNRCHRVITNSGKTSYKCPECGKLFAQSSGLHVHLKRHRNERDFACSDCKYKAFTKVDLTRHITIHTGEKNHVCQYCGKAYSKDSTLRDHVTSVHERKIKHICNQCGFATHRANNLKVHVRMRHHGEYNNHVCPVCQASIKQKSAFLEHMRSHTGERPYRCDACPAAFACTARLNVHRNSVHGERQFRCEYCKKCFQTKHHLLRHEAVHTKARPYGCPFCSYACNTQGNMAKHVRTIHNMPDYSYRKFKELQENGGQPKPLDPDWVEKGNRLTEQYLSELSEKLGRPITIEELWRRQEEMKQNKINRVSKERNSRRGSEHSYHSRMTIRRKTMDERPTNVEEHEPALYCDDPEPRTETEGTEMELGEKGVEDEGREVAQREEGGGQEEGEEEEERHPSVYEWLANSGNIQLCLETNELQVYTGDATRELPKQAAAPVEMIQGYMNEEGHFVRFNENVVVNEDDSTVVVIINSEEMQDAVPQPEMEDSNVLVNCVTETVQNSNQGFILVKQQS